MTILHVIAISLGSIGAAWALREAFRRDRPGRDVKGHYGTFTRLDWPDDIDHPF